MTLFKKMFGGGPEVPSESQIFGDDLPSAEERESLLRSQNYEELNAGDRWKNETSELRIEYLEDGMIRVAFRGGERGERIYENIDMLRNTLRNEGYVLKKSGARQTSASVIDIDQIRQRQEARKAKASESSVNQESGTIEIDEEGLREIEKIANEVRGYIERAKIDTKNKGITEEQKRERESLILEKENQLKVIQYLVSSEKTNKEETLDNLDALKTWFSTFLSHNVELHESEKESIGTPEGVATSSSVLEMTPRESGTVLVPLSVEENALVQKRRRRNPKEKKQTNPAIKQEENISTEDLIVNGTAIESVPEPRGATEQVSALPDIDTTRVVNPYGKRDENEGESEWNKNRMALSQEIAQAVGSGDMSSESQASQESAPVDTVKNQDIEKEIKFPTKDGDVIDFLDEDGKRVRYVYYDGEGLVNTDPNSNEVKPITAEILMGKLDSKELYPYSDELAKQLHVQAEADGEDTPEGVEEHEDSPAADAISAKFSGPRDEVSPEERAAARADLEQKPAVMGLDKAVDRGAETLVQKIERLKSEVAEMRAEYVKEDYENTNAWAKVKSFFRLKESSKSADIEYWQAQYQNKLIAVQEAELEQLKQSGLTGKDLKEAMAGTLQYFKLDEIISVVDARTQYRAENRGWGEKIVDTFGAMGRYYNRLSLKEKLALTAILAGGTIVTVGSGGVAGSAIAAMLVGARKVFSGSGTFVGVEALLEEHGKRSLAKKAKRETDTQMNTLATEGLGVSPEADFENLSMLLKNDIDALNGKLQDEKRAKLYRKAGAAVAGYAVGSGWLSQTIMEHLGGNEAAAWVKEQLMSHTPGTPASVAPVTRVEISRPTAADVIAPQGTVPEETSNFLKEHVLTSADGKRGLWGVIESRLPENMPKTDKIKAVAALEKLIAQKLETMSPEELKAAGFPSGNINRVMVGDTIKFDTVLSAQEIQEVLADNTPQSSAAIGANTVTPELKVAESPATNASIEPETRDAQDLAHDRSTTPRMTESVSPRAAESATLEKNVSDPTQFLQRYPDKIPDFRRELGSFRMGIFGTPEVATMEQYSYVAHGGELGNTKVVQVLADYHRQVVPDITINPLHPSQMRSVNDFVRAAAKNFGSVGYARASENLEVYTRRIAMLSLQRKMEDPGFVFKL